MDNFINSVSNLTSTLQTGGVVVAALMILVAGYFFMFGGDEGPRKAKKILIYVAVGMACILGANALAQYIADQMAF